eukprot:3377291-Pyramimonas_sp.AAC.1
MAVYYPDVRGAILFAHAVTPVATESGPAGALLDFASVGNGQEALGWASAETGAPGRRGGHASCGISRPAPKRRSGVLSGMKSTDVGWRARTGAVRDALADAW